MVRHSFYIFFSKDIKSTKNIVWIRHFPVFFFGQSECGNLTMNFWLERWFIVESVLQLWWSTILSFEIFFSCFQKFADAKSDYFSFMRIMLYLAAIIFNHHFSIIKLKAYETCKFQTHLNLITLTQFYFNISIIIELTETGFKWSIVACTKQFGYDWNAKTIVYYFQLSVSFFWTKFN